MSELAGSASSKKPAGYRPHQKLFDKYVSSGLQMGPKRHLLSSVVRGSNRTEFGTSEVDYKGKRVCVTGKMTEYRGATENVADNPGQISVGSAKQR